ncbi:HORMA domain-containing protein 1-like [Anneissia japonica]|uniref:HORMA domain-containing protein 1-like n=1 Tax=Anneissia japonica TaxID=1529436 RepID=UPI0014254BD2|nr:HORMA domain-containing protein 1-like [Anneissia japonica]
MAVATAFKPEVKAGEWSKMFPSKQVSETQSALFVKKLLAVAVSNITYLRAIFPEHAYGDRCLEDIKLKVLRDDSSCPGACQVIQWVKGCFDALDKKYLKTIVIGIYVDPNHPETVIESYTFKFSYNDDGPSINVYRNNKKVTGAKTEEETKKATIRLLRTIIVLTQSLKSLPDDVMMTMKLFFYDDVTPSEYQPPGFQAGSADAFRFEEEPINIRVGDVATSFHTVKLRIKTDGKQFEMKDNEEEDENANVVKGQLEDAKTDCQQDEQQAMDVEESIMDETKTSEIEHPVECDGVPEGSPAVPGKRKDATSPSGSEIYESALEDAPVRCPCESNEDDGLMIQCESCKSWQHAVCFAVIDEDQAPEKHLCNLCVNVNDPNSLKLTDPYLVGQSPIIVQSTCLWRRTLLSAVEMGRMLAPALAKRLDVEITVAQGLINRLEIEGYCKNAEKGKRLGKIMDKQKLREDAFKKYFTRGQSLNSKDAGTDHQNGEAPLKDRRREAKNQVELLAQRTEEIELTERRMTRSQRNSFELSQKTDLSHIREDKVRHSPRLKNSQTSSDRKRPRKVAVSVDNQNEFELCNSQDMEQVVNPGRKRRKASIAKKSVAV